MYSTPNIHNRAPIKLCLTLLANACRYPECLHTKHMSLRPIRTEETYLGHAPEGVGLNVPAQLLLQRIELEMVPRNILFEVVLRTTPVPLSA